MSYQNAFYVLPKELLEKIQEYVEGRVIYIPKKQENKMHWGENTNTRQFLDARNHQIYMERQKGMSIKALSEKYFLSEKSIQRILREKNISNN